ncbi:PP2C family protein-serine/threonine phosphatase [Streptomyces shenzhenensis]|uniref:Protein phosphatase n=1 Tax=Streptomyces shenzhenensis TaxID=943815 RepID=A0A3M0IM52_9ACTN|nr:PP2C family protein-serine/threonine phosphatase [Streptomyces shenzhenensis]RMB83116.1 protein phosphatase [Streptomyces shenzhenensis]
MFSSPQLLARPWQPSRLLLLIPVGLIMVITVADIVTPGDIVLGPLLVIAPAVTAWFEGPLVTGIIGATAAAAQAFIGWHSGVLWTRNILVQIFALIVLSLLIVVFCAVRERRTRELAQVRSVAEAAQRVLLWPLPHRLGTLQLACVYMAAEEEAEIGGDLYAAARDAEGTRVVIGDVRGKGLSAIGEAALLLGAFREAAHHNAALPELAASLEQSVTRYLADFEPTEEAGERFATVLLLEIPDHDPVARLASCGHLAPLLLSADRVATAPELVPSPPLGVGLTGPDDVTVAALPFGVGDTLLLYTDGVVEARDRNGAFYPLTERVAQWAGHSPQSLLHHIQRDLLAHTGGRLGDDAALIAIRRSPAADRSGGPARLIPHAR